MGILDDKIIDYEAFKQLVNYRSKESFNHAIEVKKPYGSLDPMIRWCKESLEGDWRWQMVEMANDRDPGRYIFYFDSEKDCFAFTLKWS